MTDRWVPLTQCHLEKIFGKRDRILILVENYIRVLFDRMPERGNHNKKKWQRGKTLFRQFLKGIFSNFKHTHTV